MGNTVEEKINDLMLWNDSNLEFVLEPEVYAYLKKVRKFIIDYNQFTLLKADDRSCLLWSRMWENRLRDLISDVFSSFCCGNFISASAMTRTLIEHYAYYQILSEHSELADDWFICNLCGTFKNDENKAEGVIRQYCDVRHISFDEKWQKYHSNTFVNAWMTPLFPEKKRPSFRDMCDHLQKPYLYDDFQSCCNMIHGQDIRGIIAPFLFYESIRFRFHLMMTYIFDTIKLTELNSELNVRIQALEDELITLIRKYAKITF